MDGRDMPDPGNAGIEPSPLMKWTSDGSMMEELLKSLTPGAQQQSTHGETTLVKDASISSTLLALIAQQDDEIVATEGQEHGNFHAFDSETTTTNPADGAPIAIKSEDSRWMMAHSGEAGQVSRAGPVSDGLHPAFHSRPAFVSPGSTPIILTHGAQGPPIDSIDATGTRSQERLPPIQILPSKLLSGRTIQTNHGSAAAAELVTHGATEYTIEKTNPRGHHLNYAAVGEYACSASGEQHIHTHAGMTRHFPQGLELQQGMCGPAPPRSPYIHPGSVHEPTRVLLPPHETYQHSSSNYSHYPQMASVPLQSDSIREQLATLDRHGDGHQQMAASLSHVGRAASAPRERPRPDVSGLPVRPGTPTEQGSDVRIFYAHAGELGSQLAAEYMREAAQTSGNSYMAPPGDRGLTPTYTATACLDRSAALAGTVDARGRPLVVPDLVIEPPAILTSNFPRIPEIAPQSQEVLFSDGMHSAAAASSALATDRGASRGKRDRSARSAKPPAGPKRSAVGPPPARPVSTDADEDSEDPSPEADGGSWEDTHMDDRDAKKQLRKEKNRASAAASRARREAYTASLEEEVAKLKEEKCWLEGQVNAPDHAMPTAMPVRAPIRHLSI